MTLEQFYAIYTPTIYETYGKDHDIVIATDREKIWTLVDDDDGGMVVLKGYHYVNRVSYFVV